MRRAFTLVELLVVIALILLLAALLYPVFRSVRDRANTVSCSSRLRQIGFAMQMYSQDNDESMPLGAYPSNPDLQPGIWDVSWHDELAPYARSWEPFFCPAAPNGINYRWSHGVNRYISGYQWALKASQIPIPADVPYTAEKASGSWAFFAPFEEGLAYWEPLNPRHGGKVNLMFMDGHVAAKKPADLILGRV